MAKIHILRPQSITPIGRYVDHRRAAPGDADVQLALACVQGFDEAKVPADLRDLIPVAQQFGIGDDVCRGLVIRKTRVADRKAVASAVGSRAQRIRGWLDSLGEPPYGTEAACFFWFLEALEEMVT